MLSPATPFEIWLTKLPKAELHLHIDGSLQAGRLLQLAEKNGVSLPYATEEEVEAAYAFTDLQSFLDLYYLGASVLQEEDDFYHLMMDYLIKCRQQAVLHTEIMIEPQTYAPLGVSMETIMRGFTRAMREAEAGWGQSSLLILSLLRHLSEAEALAMLDAAEPYRDQLCAIGLASSEIGNPPAKFTQLYREARARGYRRTLHAGEEGPAQFIWDGLTELDAERIDHGVRCTEDPALMDHLRERQIPLTVCPLSNVKLCVYDRLADHPVLQLLDRGLAVTINSDDPAYFGGYVNDNFLALARTLHLNAVQASALAANSFKASFLDPARRQHFLEQLHDYPAPQAL